MLQKQSWDISVLAEPFMEQKGDQGNVQELKDERERDIRTEMSEKGKTPNLFI
jgi:hypothetical protein